MNKIVVPAKIDALDEVLAFIEKDLEAKDCNLKVQMQIAIAAEEIFVNIAQYAYEKKDGEVVIHCDFNSEPGAVTITFTDNGVPYNPLIKEDPDISQSAEDRKIGGLGIYMVKKSMDKVQYENRNHQNILTIVKKIS